MAPRRTSSRRSRSPARLRSMRRGGERAAAISPLLLLLLLAPKAAMSQDSEVTSEQEEGEEGGSSANSEMAKAVEQYLPMFLGLLLFLAVVGWCAMNVIRASRRQNRELEEAEAAAAAAAKDAKASGSTRARARSISDRHDSLRQERGGGGTGNVSPEGVDASLQRKRSMRGSATVSGHQH
ncbi:unnamed protein product, partial [Ectocarpus fasciculatus]